jgi:hypothetical protein
MHHWCVTITVNNALHRHEPVLVSCEGDWRGWTGPFERYKQRAAFEQAKELGIDQK